MYSTIMVLAQKRAELKSGKKKKKVSESMS